MQLKKTKTFSFFSSKEDVSSEQRRIVESYFCKDRYIDSQFFLEELYGSLFLIILSYEKNNIYFYKIKNLNKISLFTTIEYKTHSHCSSLQFIDNLVIVHNFLSKIILIIDIITNIISATLSSTAPILLVFLLFLATYPSIISDMPQ